MSLSDRLRAGAECAPWIIVEVKQQEKILTECENLLRTLKPESCPEWRFGIGDCGKSDCIFCRVSRCVEKIADLKKS
jgi:hypothetical protein